jgi:hypothetical protein
MVGPHELDPFRLSGAVVSTDLGELRRELLAAQPAIMECWEDVVAASPELGGRIVVDLECEEGRCPHITLLVDEIGSAPLSRCIVGVLAGVRYTPGPGGIHARFPFVFSRGPSSQTDAGPATP